MRTTTFKHAGRTFLLLLPLLLAALSVQAAEYNYNGLYFDLDVTTREATLINSGSYGTYSGTINIPETFVGAKNLTYTVTAIGDNAFRNCPNLTAVSIPVTVETIGAYAFYGCSGLTELAIPNLVEDIGAYAFYNCSNLTAMALPPFLTTIKAYTFYGCSKLTSVTIPSNLTTIENNAFYGCSKLPRVTLSQKLTSIGSQAFYGCTSLATVSMSKALVTLGSEAFRNCSSLAAITLYNKLTTIGSSAFYGCTGLLTVTLTGGLTTIGSNAFYNTTSLQAITLPSSLTTIGDNAFAGSGLKTLTYADGTTTALRTYATGLLTVNLPESLVAIADYCFYNCTRLGSIMLPEALETIGTAAFQNCSGLNALTILPALTTIGTDAFAGTGITNLVYADGCTIALRTYATALTSVTIPNTMSHFAPDVFNGCNNLDNIFISDLEMWNYIFKSQTSIPIPVAHRIFLNGNLLTALNADFGCEIYNYAFNGCKELKQVNITNSITAIEDGAFMQCPDLEAVAVGSGTEYIGINAFQGCNQLAAVRLGNGLKVIGKNAFYGCSGLNSLFLGDNIQRIDEGAFRGCYKLPKTKLPATLTTLGPSAFRDCYELQEITIPAGVTAISDYAFYDCRKMETMEMGDAVTAIGQYAFYNCKSLKILNVPNATKTIGTYAFSNCESIRYAYLGTGITDIGNYAFQNNYNVVGFYCRAVSVPACSTNAFNGSDPQYAILYVPDESLSAYSSKSPWSSFGTKTGLSSAPVFVSTITLSSPVLIMEEGDMSQITATVEPQDATNKKVNWASSNTDVVYVNKSGNVMANEEGVSTITCTAADDNGATAKSLVIVANNFKSVTGLTLSNTTLSLVEGKEAHLTATTAPATATYSDVTWSSSNPLVAQVSEVGLVTAIATGTATITCAAADGKGAEATCAVTVTEAVDPTIGDANEDGNVSVGDLTYVLSVILGRIEQGEDISLYDVDGDGVITLEDVVGIADIILGNDHQPLVHFLEIPSTLTIGLGETTRLSRTVIPYKMEGNLTWASSNENVVAVTDDGIITALHAGTATVTLAEPDGISAECVVTVDASYGSTDGHTWVDLGLPSGTRWATVNLGALSQQEYGSYYAWGETQPKDNYNWNTYQHSNGSATTLTKYCTTSNKGTRDDKTLLEPADDAATAAWGSNWCMPSEDQFQELFNPAYTTTVWTEQNGLYGRRVTSRVNGNTLFLPAAGYMNGTTLSSGGSGGYYATRNLSTNDCDYNRSFSLGSLTANLADTYRCYGQSVRPVGSTHIDVTPATALLSVDETLTLQAALVTPSGTSSPSFTWTSSNSAVATVNSQGKVTAKALGQAIIYASLDNGLRGSCIITVSPMQNDLTVNGVTFRMVHVAGGTFQMGATEEQGSDVFDDEKPVHSVTLSDYWIGETEVTQALWYAVTGQRPRSGGLQWSSSSYGRGDNYPA
ncbi:MAG: leucine-rich repeat protein, partial [Muribaculaceae bacterium]|nr:leucine-rich repeat protein [Muribaculaceae bacterium]